MRSAFAPKPIVALALAALAGVAAALGQVPWSLWPLGLLGYGAAAWLVAQSGRWQQAALRGWVFGLAHFALALNWITEPFQVEADKDAWMAPFAHVILAAGLALFWALAGAASRLKSDFPTRVMAFALALAAVEAARGLVLSGFPWAVPGHIWLDHAPIQLGALLGGGGLTLVTLTVATLPVAFGLRGLGVAAVTLASVWGFGLWREAQPVPEPREQIIRLVQPNAPQALKWHPDHIREFYLRHLDMTAAPSDQPLSLIVWPETSLPVLLNDPGYALEAVRDAGGKSPVVVGVQRTEGDDFYNSFAIVGDRRGDEVEILSVYDKYKLAPFGEFIPFGDVILGLLGNFSFAPESFGGYSTGPGPATIRVEGLPVFQPLICYEAVFPWFMRAVERPDWMLQITNDAWFGDRAGPYQHFALTRLRAVETGLPLLRAANTGISAAIDARGRVVASLGLNEMGNLDVALPAPLPPTLYVRLGIWPVILIWAFMALLLIRRKSVID